MNRFARAGAFKPVLVLLALVALAWPAGAQTRSFLWKATSKEKPGSLVYLVGSVHMLTKDYYPLSPTLDRAYKDSTLLVEEVDLGEMLEPTAQAALLARGLLPAGQSL